MYNITYLHHDFIVDYLLRIVWVTSSFGDLGMSRIPVQYFRFFFSAKAAVVCSAQAAQSRTGLISSLNYEMKIIIIKNNSLPALMMNDSREFHKASNYIFYSGVPRT